MYNEKKITSLPIRSQSQNNKTVKRGHNASTCLQTRFAGSADGFNHLCSAASKTTKVWDFKLAPFMLNKSHHWEFSAHTTCEIAGKAAENNPVELGSCAISLPDDLALLSHNMHLVCWAPRADHPPSHQASSYSQNSFIRNVCHSSSPCACPH